MNWGYRILIVILLFIAGMGYMLSIAMKQKNEMVDDNYYAKELQHQGQIDAANHLNALSTNLSVVNNSHGFLLNIPIEARQNITNGTVIFLRSSDQRLDRNYPLGLDSNGEQLFEKTSFVRGQYTIRVKWESNQVPYFYEGKIFAN